MSWKYFFSFKWLFKKKRAPQMKAPMSTVTPPAPEPSSAVFADISRYRLCDFKKFKGRDLIFKATEGTYKVDPTMGKNIKECKLRGIRFGVYHFYRWDIDPVAQAEYFIRKVGINVLKNCFHLPIVDYESARRQTGGNLLGDLDDLKIFIKAVNDKTGRKMRMYVGDSFLGQIPDDREMLGLCDAPWVARYSSKPPKNDGIWDTIWAWQFSDKYPIRGIGKCDGNRFM